PWTFSPVTFSNEYFKLLLNETWVWKRWNGPKQLEDTRTRSLMMLPHVPVTLGSSSYRIDRRVRSRTDSVLIQDKSFEKWAKAYADDEELWF
ncbi:hypothetical protein HD554DRAFT_1979845, partial [Boletus coccyginus]